MGLLEILLLGVALATDAFSVTISNTFAFDDHRFSRLMRMPLFFGLFQFGMPLAGYFVGGIAAELIEKVCRNGLFSHPWLHRFKHAVQRL